MGMRSMMRVGMVGICTFALFLVAPTFAHAADESSDESFVEAAEVAGSPEIGLEHMREEIAAESDPELRAAMEEQLNLLESGQLDLQTLERETAFGAPAGTGETSGTGGSLSEAVTRQGFLGPPVDTGTGGGSQSGNAMPPDARAELEKIFSQGTGDPSKDSALREQAEQVMEKYGIEREQFGGGMESGGSMREAFERGGGLEQRGEGFERAMTEHMAPEAREQMERFMSERDMEGREMSHEGMEREMMEREFGGTSSETQTREFEAPTHEYEAPTHEYEAPEAPTHEYEAPTHEYEAPEAPTHEYEAPTMESPMHESDPLEGSGTGPH